MQCGKDMCILLGCTVLLWGLGPKEVWAVLLLCGFDLAEF